ncbi:MAG TPA: YdeI/OmpD-associated family protein [Edaphocola sp.]|nr:YdeI/OmpD-associated family protein [Edaphocola sp.]
MIDLTIRFDPKERTIKPRPKLLEALHKDTHAQKIFDNLPPSLKKEIVRYISFLKSDQSIQRNIDKAPGFLNGQNRFVGRDKP